uniref:Transmembrane protein n=1 Tax=Heterorhabditis bacteriophora TaxID=37862 RepID=A0A1I7W8R2_HETBA
MTIQNKRNINLKYLTIHIYTTNCESVYVKYKYISQDVIFLVSLVETCKGMLLIHVFTFTIKFFSFFIIITIFFFLEIIIKSLLILGYTEYEVNNKVKNSVRKSFSRFFHNFLFIFIIYKIIKIYFPLLFMTFCHLWSNFRIRLSKLTIVVLGSNRFIRLKELTKQHTLRVPSDAQKGFLT